MWSCPQSSVLRTQNADKICNYGCKLFNPAEYIRGMTLESISSGNSHSMSMSKCQHFQSVKVPGVNVISFISEIHVDHMRTKYILWDPNRSFDISNYVVLGIIPHICHFFYTNTFWGLEILHSKVRKFATKIYSRLNSVNYTLCVELHTVCKIYTLCVKVHIPCVITPCV